MNVLDNLKSIDIIRNTFEIPSNQKNKTIKVSKKFGNLKFNDNEFVILKKNIENDSLYDFYVKPSKTSFTSNKSNHELSSLKKKNSDNNL
jgi:hypothetical protein